MSYPTNSTLEQLNQKNLDSVIKWPEYLGQTFSKGVLSFVAVEGAASHFQYNVGDIKTLSPTLKGAILPKKVADTTLFTEPFSRFGEASVLDTADILTGNGVEQLEQQIRSIEVRILRELNNQFFNGNGVAPNLKGIHTRFSTSISGGGAPITLSLLYQARYSIKPSNESGLGWGGNAWFSNATMFRRVLELFGHHSSQIDWKHHQGLGVQVPEVLGMPWYIDENVPIVSGRSRIYAVNLNHLRIFYATHPNYPANDYGLIRIPIPSQASVSEFGELILGIYAIQNDLGSIVRLLNIAV